MSTAYYERLVQEDLNVGVGTTTKRNPGGGTLVATQVGIHTFAVGQLETETTWAPGSIAADDATSTTVTVTGAALGDFVLVSFDNMTSYLQISGYVSAANTVTVVLANPGGTVVTPTSGTVHVMVFKAR